MVLYLSQVMMEFADQILALLSSGQSAVGLTVLFVSAMFEYLFPPFPGDTVTLFGAFLAANRGWSVPLVFLTVTIGSVVGALIDYTIGRRLGLRPLGDLSGRPLKARKRVEPILEQFRRHGPIYISVNRFLPGVRALFFIAAGMAEMPVGKVLFWGLVSAMAWNALIIAVGFFLGESWDSLLALLHDYTAVAWVVVALIVTLMIYRMRKLN